MSKVFHLPKIKIPPIITIHECRFHYLDICVSRNVLCVVPSYQLFFYFLSVSPRILWISPNQTAELGNDVTLACVVTGLPTPRVVWKKDNKVLLDSQSARNITLVNISPADGGSYECSAINIVANDTRTTVLNVIGW